MGSKSSDFVSHSLGGKDSDFITDLLVALEIKREARVVSLNDELRAFLYGVGSNSSHAAELIKLIEWPLLPLHHSLHY